jgi:hypothetical protein
MLIERLAVRGEAVLLLNQRLLRCRRERENGNRVVAEVARKQTDVRRAGTGKRSRRSARRDVKAPHRSSALWLWLWHWLWLWL